MENIFIWIVFFAFIGAVLFLVFYNPIRYVYYKIVENMFYIQVKRQSNSAEGFRLKGDAKYYDEVLHKHIDYYRNLSPAAKAKFLDRINRFIYSKKFIGKEGFEVNLENQVLISAAAIQLTFGLKKFTLSAFERIYIYPDAFYFKQTKQFHKGNAGTTDFINLSYKHFMEGYVNANDKINLGLHEMTHALEFTFLFGDNYDYLFADFYDSWAKREEIEFESMKLGKEHFLRKYAKANIHEFFAVAVEHFFEAPREFKDTAPELYYRLCALLNQDPLNVHDDYSLSKSSKEIYGIKRNFLNRSNHWTYSLMATGIFVGTMLIYYVSLTTVLSYQQIILMVIAIATIGALLQYRYFRRNYWPSIIHFVSYNLLGFGIWITFLILLLNRLIPLQSTDTSFYQIQKIDYETLDAYSAITQVCKIKHPDFQSLSQKYATQTMNRNELKQIRQITKAIPSSQRQVDNRDCMHPRIDFGHKGNFKHRVVLISRSKGVFGFFVIKKIYII
jgi:Mlc titration factor MtfA (ptsG expression regulator)